MNLTPKSLRTDSTGNLVIFIVMKKYAFCIWLYFGYLEIFVFVIRGILYHIHRVMEKCRMKR